MSVGKSDVLRFYVGALLIFLTSRFIYYFVLSTLQSAEQIALEENLSSDKKNVGRKFRGGQFGQLDWLKSEIAKRLARTALYKKTKEVALTSAIGSVIGLMRVVASYDWWAVYVSDAVVTLTVEDKIILSSLRRMRLGLPMGLVCVSVMTDMQLIMYDGDFKRAIDEWLGILTRYERLSERNPKKNGYFACIVLFLTGAIAKYPGFVMFLLRYLQILVVTGRISYSTYLEILWQILLEFETQKVPDSKVMLKNFFYD